MNPDYSSPEMAYVVGCLSQQLIPGKSAQQPPRHLDWELFCTLLEENRLASFFYTLGQKNPFMYPDHIRFRLKQSRYGLLLYGDQCRRQVQDVLVALSASGLPLIVLKGWALIPTLYGDDHGQRYCEDIDILITPGNADLAEEVLRGLGYTHVDEVVPGYARRFYNARAYILVGENPHNFHKFAIGLHWGLTHYPYYDKNSVNISGIFAHALPLPVAGVDVLEMCIEDRVVYTCAHLALHHRNRETLLNYFEIAAIIQNNKSEINWEKLVLRGHEWGYLVQLQNTLRKVDEFWPLVIPADAFRMVMDGKTSWKDRLTDSLVEKTKGNRFRSALVELLSIPGIKNKLACMAFQLFPDREYMRGRYGIQDGENLLSLYIRRIMDGFFGIFNRASP